MIDQANNNTAPIHPDPVYSAAINVSIMAGLFAAIVAVMLIVNYLQINLLDPMRSERLETLKIKLSDQPKDEQLAAQIRRLDLDVRTDILSRRNISRRASLFLTGSIVVLLAAIKTASTRKKKPPHPNAAPDIQEQFLCRGRITRWLIATAIAAAGLMLLFYTGPVAEEFKEPRPEYPSEQEIAQNWPAFRGSDGSGYVNHANIPEAWDGETGDGILWIGFPVKDQNFGAFGQARLK